MGDGLPNYRFVDVENKPTVASDFTVPMEGLEAPWGMAKLVFFHDARGSAGSAALGRGARRMDREESRPLHLSAAAGLYRHDVPEAAPVELAPTATSLPSRRPTRTSPPPTGPLFAWLDAAQPNLWRSGRAFPKDYGGLRRLLADGEVDIAFAFNPSEASSAIAKGELPDTVRSYVFSGGTLGNTHFVAIPFNSNAAAGAMVLADFLMSPEAQARKQDIAVWGDPTVLAVEKLPPEEKARFAALDLGVATLRPEELGPALPEPHPSWVERIEHEWARRYGVNQ